jgi:hypothetical protein
MDVVISPRRVLTMLLSVIGVLLFADILSIIWMFGFEGDPVFTLIKLFHFGKEGNIPTLFSSFQLLGVSLLLWFVGVTQKSKALSFLPWFFLAAIFLFIAVDEVAQMHEKLIDPVRRTLGLSGLFYFAWVVPYGIAVVVFVIAFSRFLIRLPKQTSRMFIMSGAIYVSGALGIEMLGASYFQSYGAQNVPYSMFQTCEELLEMVGIALFAYSILSYYTKQYQHLRCTIKD